MLNKVKGQQQLFEKKLRFYEELLSVQVKNMQRLLAAISFKKLDKINAESKIQNGDYIIGPGNVIIDEKDLELIFDEILPLMKKYYDNKEELKRLEDLNDKRKFSLKLLVENVLTHNDDNWIISSQEFKVSKKLLQDIGEYISSPYLELCSEYFNKKIQDLKWDQSICPICGNFPAMALVNDRMNYRILWCQLCETEWNFEQTICPFCSNDDLKTLKHLFPANNSPYRIDACDHCKIYIKVIDEQQMVKKHNFIVEYLSTPYLDELAKKHGYQNFKSSHLT
jgi:formate dehydrogenase maturation protein FdhE